MGFLLQILWPNGTAPAASGEIVATDGGALVATDGGALVSG